jgi:hypothetical protein
VHKPFSSAGIGSSHCDAITFTKSDHEINLSVSNMQIGKGRVGNHRITLITYRASTDAVERLLKQYSELSVLM